LIQERVIVGNRRNGAAKPEFLDEIIT